MRRKIQIILLGLTLIGIETSCNKKEFVHSNQEITLPCECDEFADSIVGNYEGRIIEKTFVSWGGPGAIFDTITDSIINFTVTRVYPELNFIEDSARCYFTISEFFNEPISIGNSNGSFTPKLYSEQYFSLSGEFHMATYSYLNNIYWYYPFLVEAQRQ